MYKKEPEVVKLQALHLYCYYLILTKVVTSSTKPSTKILAMYMPGFNDEPQIIFPCPSPIEWLSTNCPIVLYISNREFLMEPVPKSN